MNCFNSFLVVKCKLRTSIKKIGCIKMVLMILLEMQLEDKSSENSVLPLESLISYCSLSGQLCYLLREGVCLTPTSHAQTPLPHVQAKIAYPSPPEAFTDSPVSFPPCGLNSSFLYIQSHLIHSVNCSVTHSRNNRTTCVSPLSTVFLSLYPYYQIVCCLPS